MIAVAVSSEENLKTSGGEPRAAGEAGRSANDQAG